MKLWKSILLASGAVIAFAAAAQAADLPTKKGAAAAPETPNCYASFMTWWDASPKDCPLSYMGITIYGTIDMGGGYETHASGFDPQFPTGVGELIQKTSRGGAWQMVPNGLSQSNIGIKWNEHINGDWYFIGDVNGGFDPYSLRWSSGPGSLVDNNWLPSYRQNTNGDSGRAWGPISSRAYAGFKNTTFGSLTYGRHYGFGTDNDNDYDPFGGGYAFSPLGWTGTLGGGLGLTDMSRYTNSIRYLYENHGVRAGVLSQVGGWSAGNNAQYAIEGELGFDYMGFSFNGVYEYAKDAINLGTFAGPQAGLTPDVLAATIQDLSSFQFVGKYTWQQFTAYAGYQIDRLTNPSDLPATRQVTTFNGGIDGAYGVPIQGANAYPEAKYLQVAWIGGKYTVLPTVDLMAGYYHVWQNQYNPAANCGPNKASNGNGGVLVGTASGQCAGTEDIVSGVIDWRAFKRLDLYAGVQYSQVNAGLASGFFVNNNTAFTSGVRVSF